MADDPNVRSGPAVRTRRRRAVAVAGRGTKPTPKRSTPTAKGRGALDRTLPMPPGLAKQAAGAKSARTFAPGNTRFEPFPPPPGFAQPGGDRGRGGGGYGTTDGIPNMFPAPSRGGGNRRIIGKNGAGSRGASSSIPQADLGRRGFPRPGSKSAYGGGQFDGGKRRR